MALPALASDRKADWLCKSCKGRDGQAFRNYGHRSTRLKCNVAKGSCFWKKIDAAPPRAGSTLAERQVLQQALDEKYAKRLQQKDAELANLREKLRQSEVASTNISEEEQRDKKEDADADIEVLKSDIQKLESIQGSDERLQQVLSGKRARLEELRREKQASRPVHQQLRDVQAKLDRKEKFLTRRKEVELPKLRSESESAQKALAVAESEVAQAEKELDALKATKERIQTESWRRDQVEPSTPAQSATKAGKLLEQCKELFNGPGAAPYVEVFQQLQQAIAQFQEQPDDVEIASVAWDDLDADDQAEYDRLEAEAATAGADTAGSADGSKHARRNAMLALTRKVVVKQGKKRGKT